MFHFSEISLLFLITYLVWLILQNALFCNWKISRYKIILICFKIYILWLNQKHSWSKTDKRFWFNKDFTGIEVQTQKTLHFHYIFREKGRVLIKIKTRDSVSQSCGSITMKFLETGKVHEKTNTLWFRWNGWSFFNTEGKTNRQNILSLQPSSRKVDTKSSCWLYFQQSSYQMVVSLQWRHRKI